MATEKHLETLEAYLDDELTAAERADFEAVLAGDAELAAALAEREQFRQWVRPAMLQGDAPELSSHLNAAPVRPAIKPTNRRRWVAVAMAAALTVAALSPSLLRNITGAADHRSTITRSGQVVAVRFGEQPGAAIALEAGCYHRSTGACQ